MTDHNPYAAPEAPMTVGGPPPIPAGGSLTETLAGRNHWTIGELLSDSWRLVSGFKGTCWLAILLFFVICVLSGIIDAAVGIATGSEPAERIVGYVTTALLVWPAQVGLSVLGARRAAGAETRVSTLGAMYPQCGRIAGVMILQALLICLGFICLIIPGIYLAVSYSLAPLLLVDRGLGAWESMETSRRVIGTCWFRTAGLIVTLFAFALLAIPTLGIGLIWLMPFFLICWGMLYHRLVGFAGGKDI